MIKPLIVSRVIKAPCGAVFAHLTTPERWPDAISAIEAVEVLTPEPFGLGSCFRETRTMFGRQASEDMTVAALDPPKRMLLTANNHGVRYEKEHFLEETDEGTRLTLSFSGEPQTLINRLTGRVMWLLMGNMLRKMLERDLDDLKRSLEAETA